MDITQHTSQKLVVEQKSFLIQGILAALFIAGLSLLVGSAKHYGIQATYRFTYWMGGLLALVSIGGFTFFVKTAKAIFDKETDNFKLYHRKGWIKKLILDKPLSEISSLRIDKKGNPASYRLSLQHKESNWYALQQNNLRDLKKLEYIGKHIQAFLGD